MVASSSAGACEAAAVEASCEAAAAAGQTLETELVAPWHPFLAEGEVLALASSGAAAYVASQGCL